VSFNQPPQNDQSHLDASGSAHDDACAHVLELIPAYSIGATDPDEEEFIKAMLAACPEAAEELAGYSRLAEALHYSVPQVQPPPALAENLRASLRQRAALKPERRGLAQVRRAQYWRLVAVLAAGILIVLLASNIFLLMQVDHIRRYQDQVATRLHDQDTALMLVGLGASNRLELPAVQPGTGAEDTPFAAIVWDPQGEYALLYVKNFPPLQPGTAYQLWVERDGQLSSVGTFPVDQDGLGLLVFRTAVPIPTYDAIQITVEPHAGSRQPTTPPLVQRKR
jgi:hypothetical protein